MPIGLGTATLISGLAATGVGVGTSIYANKRQSSASRRAEAIERSTVDKEIEQRRLEMEDERKRWEEEQAQLKAQWDAEQQQILADRDELRYRWDTDQSTDAYRWDVDQANAEPYREVGHGALSTLAGRAGLPAPAPRQRPTRPTSTRPPEAPIPIPTLPATDPTAPPTNRPMSTMASPPVRMTEPEPTMPVMLREGETGTEPVYGAAMSPQAYARLATSPEALDAMTPTEQQTLAAELAEIPMSALLTRPRRTARRTA